MEIVGSEPQEVSDNLVVECREGFTIGIETGSNGDGNCIIDIFDQARFIVFMLQAVP